MQKSKNIAIFSFAIPLKKVHFLKIGFYVNKLKFLNGLRYIPGIGLEWKKIQKSLKPFQQKIFFLFFF